MPQTRYSVDAYVDALPPWISVPKSAEIRGCSVAQMYIILGRGRVKAVKDGKKTLVNTQSLLDDMASLPPARITPHVRDRARQAVAVEG